MASAEPLVPCSPAGNPSAKLGPKQASRVMCGVVVATAGNLGPGWTDADVARWMRYHGGRFVANFTDGKTDGVTHVLATLDEFARPKKLQCPNMQHALARSGGRGARRVHIVLPDWLEDSLYKRRRLRETDYLLRNVRRQKQKQKQQQQQQKQTADEGPKNVVLQQVQKKQQAGQKQAEAFVNTALYRVYQDCTGFPYKVTISRGDVGERYVLHLFESLAQPPLYWFAARYYKTRRHTKPLHFRPSDTCGLFAAEFAHFCAFFLKKTGVAWDARLVAGPKPVLPVVTRIATPPDEPVDPVLPVETSAYFTYERPPKGQPVGAIEKEENLPEDA